MAVAFVQTKATDPAGGGPAITTSALSTGTTAGNTVIICVECTSGKPVSSITGGSGTFTKRQAYLATSVSQTVEIWEGTGVTAGTTQFVLTFSGNSLQGNINVIEFSGLIATGAYYTGAGSSTPVTSGTAAVPSMTPAESGDLFIGVMNSLKSTSATASNGWTDLNSAGVFTDVAYLVSSSGSASSTAWTLSSSGSWTTCGAVFRASLPFPGTGTVAASFSATGAATFIPPASGFLEIGFTATAVGVIDLAVTGAATATFTGLARATIQATGTLSATFTGAATAGVTFAATGSLTATFAAIGHGKGPSALQLPQMSIEVAFRNNPGDASPAWTDITSDVIDFQTTLGRQHELDRVESSSLRATLDNRSALYTPWNSGSPNCVPPVTYSTANLVLGSKIISNLTSASSTVLNGSLVTGQGLPPTGARVLSATSTSVTVDQPAITTVNGATIVANQGYGLVPRKPMRITAEEGGTTYPVFYGYVDAWTPQPQDALNENCTLTAYDTLKLLSLRFMNNPNLYPNLVLGHTPRLYWRMGEIDPGNQVCQDSSGSGVTGIIGGAIAQRAQAGLIVYDPTTSTTLSDQSGAGSYIQGTFTPGTQVAFQMRFSTTVAPFASPFSAILAQFPYGISFGGYYATSLLINNDGNVMMTHGVQDTILPGLGQTVNLVGTAIVNDGAPHTVTVTVNQTSTPIWTLYVDGVEQGSYTDSSLTGTWTSGGADSNIALLVGGIQWYNEATGNLAIVTAFGGTVQDVAVFPTALSGADVLAMHTTANYLQSVESTGQRIRDSLAVGGFGSWPQNIVDGLAICQGETQSTIQTSCLDYILNINDTENGLFFQDTSGVLRFFDRHHVMTNATSNTSQATWADNTSTPYHYEAQTLAIPSDTLDLWTDVQVQRNAGATVTLNTGAGPSTPQVSTNTETQVLLGYSSLQRSSTLFDSDIDAMLLADWLRYLYSIPKIRVSALTLTGEANGGANYTQMLGRKLLERVTVQRLSPQSTVQLSQDLVVESISHQVTAVPGQWRTTFTLSPFEIVDNPFIVDSSLIDGPDIVVG